MLVRGPGIPDQRRGPPVAVPALAKGHKQPGIEPERASVLMGGQQLPERAVIVLYEQAPGENVPYPWLSFGFNLGSLHRRGRNIR